MRKIRWRLGGVLMGAAVIAIVGASTAHRWRPNGSNAKFTIETAVVDRGDVARLVSAAGSVRALTTVEVGSQLSGQILELNADFNTQVTQGQIIARIDPQSFETRVESARADVESAKANVAVRSASIKRAEANLAQIRRDFTRQNALFAEDAIARSVLEESQRQLDVAKADLELERAQYRSAEATLTQRTAALRTAEVDLERTVIRSPITGVVIERNVDVGQTVAASLSAPILFRIAQDLGDIRIDAAVVEADIGGINAGDPASFRVDAYPEIAFEGVVEQVRLAGQELQNVVTYTVVIAAANPRGRLLPGMTANVEITADKREDVLRIADAAVRFRPPRNGPEVIERASADGGGQSPGARPRGGPMMGRLLDELNIDEARRTTIREELQAEFRSVQESFGDVGAQFDRARMRERMVAVTERVLRRNLTEEEFATYVTMRERRINQRAVDVHVIAGNDALASQSIIVGLSDGTNVEILGGAEEGDEFVVRVREHQADRS